MKGKIGIALVGTGEIARHHADAIVSGGNSRLVAVRSSDINRAREFAKRYGVKAYVDYEEMLKDNDVNAVDIVNANYLHADFGIKAGQAGKHVLVEKPIDISLEKADRLIEVCRKNNVKLSVISQHRFDRAVLRLKNAVERDELGKLLMGYTSVKWHRSSKYYEGSGGWRKKRELVGGGVLLHQAIHFIDILRWLMGPVASVQGRVGNLVHKMDCEDSGAALIKFKSGAVGVVEASTAVPVSVNDVIEMHGERAAVRLENNKIANRIVFWRGGNSVGSRVADFLRAKLMMARHWRNGSFSDQIEDFCEAILNNRKPFVSGEDGRETLELILAIYKSDKLGREVQVNI